MATSSRIRNLLRNLFRRRRAEADLNDELRSYVDELTERKIKAGSTPEAARRQALMETGAVEQLKDDVRDQWAGLSLDLWWKDVQYAIRSFRRTPVFTLVAVLSLAIGIGANTALFTVVDAILL